LSIFPTLMKCSEWIEMPKDTLNQRPFTASFTMIITQTATRRRRPTASMLLQRMLR